MNPQDLDDKVVIPEKKIDRYISICGFSGLSTTTEMGPIEFLESPIGLNTRPLPVMKFALKMFYSLELDDTEKTIEITDKFKETVFHTFTEKEFLRYLSDTGKCNTSESDGNWREAVFAMGRRGTKTSIAAIVESYEAYKLLNMEDPLAHYKVLGEDTINLTNAANTKKQAAKLFSIVRSYVERCPFFTPYLSKIRANEIELRSKADIQNYNRKSARASVILGSHACNSRGLRGGGNLVITLDEFAHFMDTGGNASDDQMYNALTPSTGDYGRDGRILILSSPLNKSGKFYELYVNSMDPVKGKGLLMLQIPTWISNPHVDTAFLRDRWNKDGEERFMVEYGGEFSERISGFITREEDLMVCVEQGEENHRMEQIRGDYKTKYFMGVDIGLEHDGSAITIAHVDNSSSNVVLDFADVFYPMRGEFEGKERLSLKHDIAPRIENLCKAFRIQVGVFDQWCGAPLEEELHERGMRQFHMIDFSYGLNSKMWQAVLSAILEAKIELYNHPDLITELLSLQRENTSQYGIRVHAPDVEGKHDDLSSSFARAVYLALGGFESYLGGVAKITNPVSVVSLGKGTFVSKSNNQNQTFLGGAGKTAVTSLLRQQQFRRQVMNLRANRGMKKF